MCRISIPEQHLTYENQPFEEWLSGVCPTEELSCQNFENFLDSFNPITRDFHTSTDFPPSPPFSCGYENYNPPLKRKEADEINQLYKAVKIQDPKDVQVKKKKQNAAAARCRQKRSDQLNILNEKVKELEEESFRLNVKLTVMKAESDSFKAREDEYLKEISSLKQQLQISNNILLQQSS
jgi:hypothetical protein